MMHGGGQGGYEMSAYQQPMQQATPYGGVGFGLGGAGPTGPTAGMSMMGIPLGGGMPGMGLGGMGMPGMMGMSGMRGMGMNGMGAMGGMGMAGMGAMEMPGMGEMGAMRSMMGGMPGMGFVIINSLRPDTAFPLFDFTQALSSLLFLALLCFRKDKGASPRLTGHIVSPLSFTLLFLSYRNSL